MKKYLFANIGGSDRAAVADYQTGKISVVYLANGLWFFNDLSLSMDPDPSNGITPFDGYVNRFEEISQTQFQTFLSSFQTRLNSL